MTPLTITKDEYSGKWVAWHLPSDKVVDFTSEEQSKVFWRFTNNFYLLGVGGTEKIAIAKLALKITDFTYWLKINRQNLNVFDIASNLPEYRNAIFEFNTEKYF